MQNITRIILNLGWTIGIAAIVSAFILSPVTASAQMNAVSGAPEGFEILEKPQALSVSLYYGGNAIGNAAAQKAPGTITFDNPDAVMDLIPTISKRDVVGDALKTALPMNEDKKCSAKNSDNCGELQPKVVGLIYDDRTMSAELFINKDYLSLQKEDTPRYLPLPERSLSSIYSFNGAVSGTQGDTPSFSVSNDAVHAYGEMKLTTQTTVSNNGMRFDTAAASVDRNGWNGTAGMFRSAPMRLMSDRDMVGVSYATSNKTRMDAHKTEGNQIIIYLPRRSFVSIYREGRLYSSKAYEAGNQEIDTSELPDGAYNITLKIEEADGTKREETRFFAKQQDIPAAGKPAYYMQAGLIRENAENDDIAPRVSGDPIIRAGTVRRVKDNMAAGVAVLGVKDRIAVEAQAYVMIPEGQAQFAALGSSKGDAGLQASYYQTRGRFSVAIDASKMWSSDDKIPGFEDVSTDITQASATASFALNEKVTLGARASYVKDKDMAASTTIGPYAEWRIWQKGESMLVANANAARNEGQNDASVIINFSRSFGSYGVTSSAGSSFGSKNKGPLGNTRVWHQKQEPGNNLLVGAGMSGDKESKTMNADADWENNWGKIRGSVQDAMGGSAKGLSYGGNISVNALQKGGEIHIGGEQTDKSAVIVKTGGNAQGEMVILVNDVPRSTVKVGDERVIYLTPFHSYNIRLEPKEAALLDYESGNRRVTLYPGNVLKEKWEINKFYAVVATILDKNGQPFSDALVKEAKEQTATDESGLLQAELSDPHHITLEKDGAICTVNLPEEQPVNGVLLYRETLVCQ